MADAADKCKYGERVARVRFQAQVAIDSGRLGISAAELAANEPHPCVTSMMTAYLAMWSRAGSMERVPGTAKPVLWMPGAGRKPDARAPATQDREHANAKRREARAQLKALRNCYGAQPAASAGPAEAQAVSFVREDGVRVTVAAAVKDMRFVPDEAQAFQSGGFLAEWQARRAAGG